MLSPIQFMVLDFSINLFHFIAEMIYCYGSGYIKQQKQVMCCMTLIIEKNQSLAHSRTHNYEEVLRKMKYLRKNDALKGGKNKD